MYYVCSPELGGNKEYIYKSHDARTMTLRKSQGVGTLTVRLSCNYVHGFKRLSMFNFAFHLNYVSKSCDHKS